MTAFADTVAFALAPPGHVLLRITKHLSDRTSSPDT
jgi:hypothetical protein